MQTLLNQDGIVELYNDWLKKSYANKLLNELAKELDWQTEEITLFGKNIKCPRLTAFYGDPDVHYRYSGTDHPTNPWPIILLDIRDNLLNEFNYKFNSVLCNLYEDGNNYIGWHSDNEAELGNEPIIASISLGETRTLQFKHKIDNNLIAVELNHGSLCIMRGETQHYWKHRIPPTRKKCGLRINLTFRNVRPNISPG